MSVCPLIPFLTLSRLTDPHFAALDAAFAECLRRLEQETASVQMHSKGQDHAQGQGREAEGNQEGDRRKYQG
jgi:hypothetical protein